MRIAWFSHRYYPCVGGAENYGREMVSRFTRRGYHADVFTSDAHDLWYFTKRNRKRVDAEPSSFVDGARVRRFAVRHYPLQRYVGRLLSHAPHWPTQCRTASYMPILPGIERVRGKYDAVFAVGFPYTVFSFAAWKTARASNAPLILTPFLHLATPGDPVNRAYTKPHQIRLLREADCVVVQTVGEFEAVRGWGIPAEKILKLGMGVDVEAVTGGDRSRFRSELGIAGNSWVVGHLATLDPNKGTIDLIRSVSILNRDRSASESVQLILAGPSSPCFERFLRDEPELASRPWLKRLGPLPSEDRADFFAAIDAFAMPSRTDSFGIVFLEAWANGLPVVAAAAGGVVEVVDDGSTGYLVPFGDSNALADRIGRLLNDPELSRRLGDAGRVRIANGFSWDDRFGTLLERTNRLISERSAALHARIA